MKIKRFIAVILSAFVIAAAFPVSAFAAERTQLGMIDEFEAADNLNFISDNKIALALERIYQGYLNHDTNIDLYDLKIPTSQANALYQASVGVYPELFFVEPNTYSMRDGYISNFTPEYIFTAEEIQTMLGEFYAKADEYLAYVDDSMDDFTKAVVLHDQLAINNVYSIYNPDGSGEYSNNYYFMVEGWGRCENYAECYAYLLAQVGIKSEIIDSDEMVHEWMKIKLDGSDFYYNIDLTWDDPSVSYGEGDNGADEPGKVRHGYFLLSDEAFQTTDLEHGRNLPHYDYEYINNSDSSYDNYNNLHTLEYPLFYLNGILYTVHKENGYIVTYNHNNDSFTNVYKISDCWQAVGYGAGASWDGNFSGIAEHNGFLYLNGEKNVYVYDPAANRSFTYIENAVTGDDQLYGLYIKDGKLMGRVAQSPNARPEELELGDCFENIAYFDAGDGEGAMEPLTTTSDRIELPESSFTAPESKVFGGWSAGQYNFDAGNSYIFDGGHSQTFTARWLGYYDINIENSDNGTVTVENSESVLEGSEVTLTVAPDELAKLESLNAFDAYGNPVPVDEGFTFTMPGSGVTVSAVFSSPLTRIYDASLTTDTNIQSFFPGQTIMRYGSLELMGVQERADTTRGVRFVTVVNSDILSSDKVEDYGYIFTLSNNDAATVKQNAGNLNIENANHSYSCKGTYNTFCADGYGSADFGETEYKYVTAAVNDIPDNGVTVCARFYVKLTSGTVLYANYAEFDGCAFNFEENA